MSEPKSVKSTYAQNDTIKALDDGMPAVERTAETIDFEATSADEPEKTSASTSRRKPGQLKVLDDLFGPLRIGPYTVTRRALDALGATIDGQPLTGHNTHFRTPSRSFINALQLSYPAIEKRMKVSTFGDGYLLPSLLFELAVLRPDTAPPVIREDFGASVKDRGYANKMARLLNSAQTLDLRQAYSSKRKNPSWLIVKDYSAVGASVGVQAFGLFMGIRGIYDAVKRDDPGEIIFNSIGVGTEVASIITDIAVTKAGQHMIEAGSGALKDFIKTRMGLRLGRSGGLLGGIFTLPFDIVVAVKEFSSASNATGKAAMDHYVSGGLSIASAAMTVILGAAAYAGFAFAGPVGLVAGIFMAVGSQIYGAVRMVDEIDDYIELTAEERWSVGWAAFVPFKEIDQDIKNRYELARAKIETAKRMQATARQLLEETGGTPIEAVVHGNYEDRLIKRPELVEQLGLRSMRIKHVPVVVGLDDTIDAREGVTAETPGAVLGTPGETTGVMWLLSSGRDTVTGVADKPNLFYYTDGVKNLTGGDKDDTFIFQNSADDLARHVERREFSRLEGGAGSDTLMLGSDELYPSLGRGYHIDLEAGTLRVFTPNPDPSVVDGETYSFKAHLESIENVQTLQNGRSVVTGTAASNMIVSKGADTINAGAGDDRINLYKAGASAFGESGVDHYYVGLTEGEVLISEDGVDESIISLGWRMDQIEKWEVHRCRLTIIVKFDFHYGRTSRITFDNIYKQIDGRRVLQNDKLTIITHDKYHLKPDLPETIEHNNPVEINAKRIEQGRPGQVTILHDVACRVPTRQNTDYYLQRYNPYHHFLTNSFPDSNFGTRIFLDYDYAEMTSAQVFFVTTPAIWKNEAANKDKIDVSCNFLFCFGESKLQISGVGQYKETTLDAALKNHVAKVSIHGYMLVFRDGISHTLILEEKYAVPPAEYEHNVVKLIHINHNLRFPLRTRDDVVFELPVGYAQNLGGSCIQFEPLLEQTSIINLEGEGIPYLLHLHENRVARLSTPGGLATAKNRLDHSSTWSIDATQIKDFKVVLSGNKLYIGTVTLHLPQYDAEDLIDQIFVIGPKGVVHTVDLTFDRVYIDSLDARYFEPPTMEELPEELSSLVKPELYVRNIAMRDGTRGRLKYNLANRKWILDSNKSREINYSQLVVFRQCKHNAKPVSLPDN